MRALDATHVYTGIDLARLSGTLKPSAVVTAADLARIGTRVPEFYKGDLFCSVGRTPLYLGQPVALLIFEQFDSFDQARPALRDGTFVKFGEETGPVVAPDYGAYRFTRMAGPTPDAPDVYSPVKDGWVSPGHFQSTERPVWTPLGAATASPYAKAASYGEQIRAELAASSPALLALDREFETQSVDPMFLEPKSASPGTIRAARNSSSWSARSRRTRQRSRSRSSWAKPAPPSGRRTSTPVSPMSAAASVDATIPRSPSTSHWRGCSFPAARSGSPMTVISSSRAELSVTHSRCTRGSGSSVRPARLSRSPPTTYRMGAASPIIRST